MSGAPHPSAVGCHLLPQEKALGLVMPVRAGDTSPSRDPSLHRPALSFLSGSEESRRAIPLEDDNEREVLNLTMLCRGEHCSSACTPSKPKAPLRGSCRRKPTEREGDHAKKIGVAFFSARCYNGRR